MCSRSKLIDHQIWKYVCSKHWHSLSKFEKCRTFFVNINRLKDLVFTDHLHKREGWQTTFTKPGKDQREYFLCVLMSLHWHSKLLINISSSDICLSSREEWVPFVIAIFQSESHDSKHENPHKSMISLTASIQTNQNIAFYQHNSKYDSNYCFRVCSLLKHLLAFWADEIIVLILFTCHYNSSAFSIIAILVVCLVH